MAEPIEAGESRLVLLVDDDVDSRRHVRRLLELRGMEVVQATNGLAALELLQRLPAAFGWCSPSSTCRAFRVW